MGGHRAWQSDSKGPFSPLLLVHSLRRLRMSQVMLPVAWEDVFPAALKLSRLAEYHRIPSVHFKISTRTTARALEEDDLK